MKDILKLCEAGGLYSTVLPAFDHRFWPIIVSESGFVWINSPFVDLSGEIDSIVSKLLFGSPEIELKCLVHQIEFDVSIPAIEFLHVVEPAFPHGLDFVLSEKRQPPRLRLTSISRTNWPSLMVKNQISLVFHRPGGGEPSLITSCNKNIVASIINRFSVQ